MSKFKNLNEAFEDAKYRSRMADKHLQKVLEQMVQAGCAKVVPCDDIGCDFFLVGEKQLLSSIEEIEFLDEFPEFYGIDDVSRQEAAKQGCDPNEFWGQIILMPGEKIDYFMKRTA